MFRVGLFGLLSGLGWYHYPKFLSLNEYRKLEKQAKPYRDDPLRICLLGPEKAGKKSTLATLDAVDEHYKGVDTPGARVVAKAAEAAAVGGDVKELGKAVVKDNYFESFLRRCADFLKDLEVIPLSGDLKWDSNKTLLQGGVKLIDKSGWDANGVPSAKSLHRACSQCDAMVLVLPSSTPIPTMPQLASLIKSESETTFHSISPVLIVTNPPSAPSKTTALPRIKRWLHTQNLLDSTEEDVSELFDSYFKGVQYHHYYEIQNPDFWDPKSKKTLNPLELQSRVNILREAFKRAKANRQQNGHNI